MAIQCASITRSTGYLPRTMVIEVTSNVLVPPSVSNDARRRSIYRRSKYSVHKLLISVRNMASEPNVLMEANLGEEGHVTTKEVKPVKITVAMIAKRNLPPAIVSEGSEQLIHKMLKLTHVRLDRENIGEIDHMEVLGPVTNLYLQQNFIEKIENLESLMEIRFLVLSGNKIKVVENIELLDKLQFLDLADNLIENLDAEKFPKSLMILNLTGNPCFAKNGYRLEVIKSLPGLKQLDGEMVTDEERREAGHEIVSESDEDSDDDEGLGDDVDKTDSESYHKSLDDVLRLSADLISKSKNRTLQYLSSHDGKMAAIEEIRSQSRQEMTSARSEVTPR